MRRCLGRGRLSPGSCARDFRLRIHRVDEALHYWRPRRVQTPFTLCGLPYWAGLPGLHGLIGLPGLRVCPLFGDRCWRITG